MRPFLIRHDQPAGAWTGASPLGNGRMGAMVNGGTHDETIHLNEDTLWSGEPRPHHDGEKCLENLEGIRDLIFGGKHPEATALGQASLLGVNNQCYQPLGNLRLTMPGIDAEKVSGYDRVLDLNRAVSITTFTHEGVKYERSVFISHPDQVLVVHLTSSGKNQIDMNIALDSLLEHEVSADASGVILNMSGRTPLHADPHYAGTRIEYDHTPSRKGMRFRSSLNVDAVGGTCEEKDSQLQVRGATAVTIKLSAATSYNGFDRSPSAEGLDEKALVETTLEKIHGKGFDALLRRHIADYAPLFERVDVQFGDTDKQGKPVAHRIGSNYQPGQDPDLDELFYQFGRYLLIASSREGSQPANLQGIWSYKLNPSWSANWTMNCNAQFNYIGAGAAGLPNLTEPFRRMVQEASIDGSKVAETWYGSDGWVFHHNLDLWRAAIPSGGSVLWATFPTGGAWSSVELFDQWKFSYDKRELHELWPILKGNVEFWLGNLVEHPETGELVSCPDVYFENTGRKPDGTTVLLCSAPVSSTIIIRQSFLDLLEAAELLDINNDPVLAKTRSALKRLPQIKINSKGEIRQWNRDLEDTWKESDSTQLLVMNGAIYTSQITPRKTPELAKALSRMLGKRKLGLNGEGSWRAAFPANTYARLGQGNRSQAVLAAFYKTWANPNLTARFIQSDWEIDGNLGMMGAVQECLVQSHAGEIELLPALPDAWRKEGFVKGIGVRGGYTLNFAWKDGKVTDWKLQGSNSQKVHIRINGDLRTVIAQKQMLRVERDATSKQVVVYKGMQPVLQYNDQTVSAPEGFTTPEHSRKYAVPRSNYIHPLYGLAGQELTLDYSTDHPHHRGIYWAWPEVTWNGQMGDLHALQTVFARPTTPATWNVTKDYAEIKGTSEWLWKDKTPIVRETVIIRVHPSGEHGRFVDFQLTLEAIDKPVSLGRRGRTAYGGLNIRLAPIKNLKLQSHADGTNPAWSDGSGFWKGSDQSAGLTVFESLKNPGYPGDYIEYPGLPWFQPAFPRSGTVHVLEKGTPLTLRYRFWIRTGGPVSDEQATQMWHHYQN